MNKKVFISYRRADTAAAAGRLYDRFCHLLGAKNVFLDVDAIEAGENFEAKIQREIGKANAILVLIGNSWMAPAPGQGKPRLFDEGDHVRAEVKFALRAKAFTMPVLVDNAAMPDPGLLPDDISGITLLNAPPLRYESFDADADRIARKALGLSAGETGLGQSAARAAALERCRRGLSGRGGAARRGTCAQLLFAPANFDLDRRGANHASHRGGAHFRAYRGASPWLKAAAALGNRGCVPCRKREQR